MNSFPYGICCDTVVSIEKIKIPERIEEKVYEVMRIIDGKILYFDEHMDRMERSIRFYLPSLGLEREKVLNLIHQLVELNDIREVNVRIEGYLRSDNDLHLIGYLVQGVYPSEEQYQSGVTVKRFDFERKHPTIKSIDSDYKAAVTRFIENESIYEAVLYHEGRVTEGSRSNIFFIKGNVVYSARKEDILSGITRRNVVQTMKDLGIEYVEVDIPIEDAGGFDAAFLTGTSIHILPIRQFDEVEMDVEHPVLRLLMEGFQKTLERHLTD